MHGGWFVVAPVALPLLLRAAVAGALLGAFVGAGLTLVDFIAQQHGSLWLGFTQMVVLAMIGIPVGALAGLMTGVGALISLRMARMSSPESFPSGRAGALGAGLMTSIYIGVGLTLVWNMPLPSFVTATGFGVVAALFAAFQIRRLNHRRPA